jgi:hypothetical protein
MDSILFYLLSSMKSSTRPYNSCKKIVWHCLQRVSKEAQFRADFRKVLRQECQKKFSETSRHKILDHKYPSQKTIKIKWKDYYFSAYVYDFAL